MAQDKDEKIIVKKVKPYPFTAQFAKDGQAFAGRVMKLVTHGFMVDLGTTVIKVGDVYQVQFLLPTSRAPVMSLVKVIKTYDRYQNPESPTKAMRLAEFHFITPGEDLKKIIKDFLKAIKQVGTDLV